MLIEEALMTFLLSKTTITAYVGQRIHFVQAPQAVARPYIVVSKVDAPREHSHDGSSQLAHPRFQLSIFAPTYGEAKNIAAAVQAQLQGYTGTMGGEGGVAVQNTIYEDENDFYEEDSGLFHVACDYIIWHEDS